MEEILASIRRIMADDEPPPPARRPAAVQQPGSPRYGEPAAGSRHDELPAGRQGEPAGPGRRAASQGPDGRGARPQDIHPADEGRDPRYHAPPPRPMPQESAARQVRAPSVAPAELPDEEMFPAARMSHAPEAARRRAPEPDMHEFEEELARTVRPLRNDAERTSVLHELQAAAAMRPSADAAPGRAAGDDGRPVVVPRPAAPEWPRAGSDDAGRRVPREAGPPPARESSVRETSVRESSVREDGPRRRDLLSPGVDAAVAAAFQSLGDVVLPHKERTIEDLVKEILRPMLKDWLDQRLPGIVEGLVRAEIERVSRQPR